MRLLALLLASLLIALPARAQTPPVIALWINPALPPATDAAVESQIIRHTLARTIELFVPLDDAGRDAINRAADAFARRTPFTLTASDFDNPSPTITFTDNAAPLSINQFNVHRQWALAQRGGNAGTPAIELFIDVDALRRQCTESFASGRAGRVIHALGVPNARSLAIHGRLIPPADVPLADPALPLPPSSARRGEYTAANGPPLLRLDLSWNSRADEPTIVRGLNIAAGHWPIAHLKLAPPASPFLCILRADARTCLASALNLRAAWLEPDAGAEFARAARTWLDTNRPALNRLTGSLPPWLLLHPDPEHPDTLILASIPRSDALKPDAIADELDRLIRRDFNSSITLIPDAGTRVPAPPNWPFREVSWNPAQQPPQATIDIRVRLRSDPPIPR